MTEILFHPDVRMDINESYSFYENQSHGLGDDFLIELEQALSSYLRFACGLALVCERF